MKTFFFFLILSGEYLLFTQDSLAQGKQFDEYISPKKSKRIALFFDRKERIKGISIIDLAKDSIGYTVIIDEYDKGLYGDRPKGLSIYKYPYENDFAYDIEYNDTLRNQYSSLITLFRGRIIIQAELFDNVYHGTYREFYLNGRIKKEGEYQPDTVKGWSERIGIWKTYYENGKLESQGAYLPARYIPYTKAQIDSAVESQMKENYDAWVRDGKLEFLKGGEWEYFNDQGKLIRKEWYNPKGKLKRKEEY